MGLFDTIEIPQGTTFQTKATKCPWMTTYRVGDRIDCRDGLHEEEAYEEGAAGYWFLVHHGRLVGAGQHPGKPFSPDLPWDAPERFQYDPAASALLQIRAAVAAAERRNPPVPELEAIDHLATEGLYGFIYETDQEGIIWPGYRAWIAHNKKPEPRRAPWRFSPY